MKLNIKVFFVLLCKNLTRVQLLLTLNVKGMVEALDSTSTATGATLRLEDFFRVTEPGPGPGPGAHHHHQDQDQNFQYPFYPPLFGTQPTASGGAPEPKVHPLAADDDQLISDGMREWVQQEINGCDHHQESSGIGSQSCCVAASQQITSSECVEGSRKRSCSKQIVHRKSLDTFGQRTSQYRGVTRHRWTGRYEAHLWDNSCKKEGQTRKGRQVYLGGYDTEEKAARAYDLAALKYWGPSTHINFPLESYQQQLEEMKSMSRQEFVAHLRRKSSGFSRGASIYRGVTRHHQHGRWQARIGRVAGNKDLYLGTFSSQEEAAEAYDIAAIKFRGANAVTNFDISRYNVGCIMASSTLLAGELARRTKELPSRIDDVTVQNYELEKIDTIPGPNQQEMGSPLSNTRGAHFSNPSSLVSSLNSSREGSPTEKSFPLGFKMPPSAAKLFGNPSVNDSRWINQSVQITHPSIVMKPQIPVFATWADLQ